MFDVRFSADFRGGAARKGHRGLRPGRRRVPFRRALDNGGRGKSHGAALWRTGNRCILEPMSDRRTALRALSLALLLFGLVYEAGHLRHHLEHAHHVGDADHATHRECLVYHTGALVEHAVEAPACDVAVDRTEAPAAPSAVAGGPRLLPEPRAPPASC